MIVRSNCGCRMDMGDPLLGPVSLHYCPTHSAAPALYDALKAILDMPSKHRSDIDVGLYIQAVIAQAEGKPPPGVQVHDDDDGQAD